MSQQKNLSIFYIYEEYIKQQKENNVGKMLNTALLRFLIPYWGGKFPQGKRCSPQEIEEGLSLLGTLPINLLLDAIDVAEEAFVSQSVTLPNRRVYRSILKNFLDWSKTKDYFVIETESNTKTKTKRRGRTRVNPRGIRFYNNAGKPKKDWNTGFHNKIAFKKPYALMALNNRGKQVYPNDYINSTLQDELTRFERFLSLDGLRKVTIENYFTRVKQFLGWLHRCKNIPLEDLRLNLIIPYCQLNIELNEDDDWNKFAILKHKTGQKANEIANQCIDMLIDYFTFLNKHPNTELEVLKAFIRLGQFIYREEIGTNEYPTIKNIPVLAKSQTYAHKLIKGLKILSKVFHIVINAFLGKLC